jgi:LPS sulfotransferase NodH
MNARAPSLSYTIWFSQRTGSSLLCKALESTGIAGNPAEWFHTVDNEHLYDRYQVTTPEELQHAIWNGATGANGVLGLKTSVNDADVELLRGVPGCRPGCTRPEVWENAFPNHRHVWMTRRNKVQLAVSWWKAIQTKEWHRVHGEPPTASDVRDQYHYPALVTLFNGAALREVSHQRFFDEGDITPYTIVYEDFIRNYSDTVISLLQWLGLDTSGVKVGSHYYEKLADDVSDEWAARFEKEHQVRHAEERA